MASINFLMKSLRLWVKTSRGVGRNMPVEPTGGWPKNSLAAHHSRVITTKTASLRELEPRSSRGSCHALGDARLSHCLEALEHIVPVDQIVDESLEVFR